MLGSALGVVAGLLVVGTMAAWFHLMRQVRIPADRRAFLAANAVGVALGVTSLLLDADALGASAAGVGILGGLTFLGLAAQSPQPAFRPAVAVGEPIIDFTLPDHEGRPFDLASLRGRPFLLKFFRGHW